MPKLLRPQSISVSWGGNAPKMVLLSVVIFMQATCSLFFLWDVITDLQAGYLTLHIRFELLAVLTLIAGVATGTVLLRNLINLSNQSRQEIERMRERISKMIKERMDMWDLTRSETEVAWMVLKGFDIDEIAHVRKTASGTVRAQLSRIYEKSETHSQSQFIAQFLDLLLAKDQPNAIQP
ncbi:LuxR C-terminal-related transcriptional regulator [Thalassovita sp.]|uniref:helix-turn-helix transcriptional regulator n=1 Tax=Thalassovita sp. TaxID=1979401 RepID=UPI0029DE7B2F|nr:LuxR C-terminal-related transcriptional regulator [Thalassovita sp.]